MCGWDDIFFSHAKDNTNMAATMAPANLRNRQFLFEQFEMRMDELFII